MKSQVQRSAALRWAACVGAAASMVFTLVACSSNGDGGGAAETSGGDTGAAQPLAGHEITVFNRWSDPASQAAAKELLDGFTAETGIKVNNAMQPNSGDTYQPAVRAALSSSAAPDLATNIAGPELYQFAESGTVQDITDFYQSVIAPRATGGASAGLMYNGKNYAISADTSIGNVIWYNPDYLAKYDVDATKITTFEEWVVAMQKIKDAGGTPIVIGAKDQWPGGHYLNDLVQRAIGSKMAQQLYDRSVAAGIPDTPKWTDAEIVKALQDYVDMKPLFQDGFLGEAEGTAGALFLSGEVGFYEMGSWFLSSIQSTPPAFQPGIMLFPPYADGADGSETTIANTGLMVSTSADLEAAEAFMEYYTRPDVAARHGAAASVIMPYKLAEGAGKVDAAIQPLWDGILALNANASDSALFNDQGINVEIYTQYIWQGSVGLMNGDITPQQLAQQLEDATAAAQAKNG